MMWKVECVEPCSMIVADGSYCAWTSLRRDHAEIAQRSRGARAETAPRSRRDRAEITPRSREIAPRSPAREEVPVGGRHHREQRYPVDARRVEHCELEVVHLTSGDQVTLKLLLLKLIQVTSQVNSS